MNFPIGLDSFLAALRAEGVPVGTGELVWLQHAFQLEPRLDRQGLKDLLACTLAKDETQRSVFDALFEDWCPDEAFDALQEPDETQELKPIPEKKEPPKPPPVQRKIDRPKSKPTSSQASKTSEEEPVSHKRRLLGIVGLLLLLVFGLMWWAYVQWVEEQTIIIDPPLPPPPTVQPLAPEPDIAEMPSRPTNLYWTWVPSLTIRPPPLIQNGWFLITLGGVICLTAGGLALWYWWRSRDPKPAKSPKGGPEWLPLLALEGRGPELLGADDLRSLVWGIGRFVSEDRTQQVDLNRTVTATARAGGIPTIH